MKAQYISTPGRAKKIIVAVWLCAIGLSVFAGIFCNGSKYCSEKNLTLCKEKKIINNPILLQGFAF